MSKETLIKQAIDSMVKYDEKVALEVMNNAIAEGCAVEVLSEGFSAGIREVGDLFGKGRVFLPELMLAADVMQKVSDVLNAEMAKSGAAQEKKGVMILATVQGDVHDIGKGIVASLIKTQGIEVIDIGRDVAAEKIVDAAVEHDAQLIGTSALLTTTMAECQKLENILKERGLKDRFKTMIGGAPVTERFAKRIGADAYGEDAAEAVEKALELLS